MTNKEKTNNEVMNMTMTGTAPASLQLRYEDLNTGWPLCFNSQCSRCAECLHYMAGQTAPGLLTWHPVVTPRMAQAAKCPYYASARTITVARGFSHLFDRVLKRDFTAMRRELTDYLHGKAYYYEYRRGERVLSPAQQQWIQGLMKRYGYAADNLFDGYESQYYFPVLTPSQAEQAMQTA